MYHCTWPEAAWLPDVTSSSVTWPRKGSLGWGVRMRERRLRNIRPTGAFSPEVTSLNVTSPRKLRNIQSNVTRRSSPGAWDARMCERKCPITNLFNPTQKKIEMFYITNQSTVRKSDQSEVAISGRLANQIAINEPIIIGWLLLRLRPNNIYSNRIVNGILAFWQTMTMFTCEKCGK
jgi:hypothetical protein